MVGVCVKSPTRVRRSFVGSSSTFGNRAPVPVGSCRRFWPPKTKKICGLIFIPFWGPFINFRC